MKIVILGAGSARTPSLVSLLYQNRKSLNLDVITFYDIDEQRLIMAETLTHALLEDTSDVRLEIAKTAREAFTGADFVLASIRVGLEEARARDERIALKHNVIGQETTGAVGFSSALRSIPAMIKYAKLLDEVAPNAWLINFTNPSSIITQGLFTVRQHHTVGICDHPMTMRTRIAKVFGIDPEDMMLKYSGLNHLGWASRIEYRGIDLIPELLASKEKREAISKQFLYSEDLISMLQAVPNEYLYYFYYRNLALANQLKAEETRGEFLCRIDTEFQKEVAQIPATDHDGLVLALAKYMNRREETYLRIERGALKKIEKLPPREEIVAHGFGYAGVALDIMKALIHNQPKEVIVNLPVSDKFPGLHPDDVAELNCMIKDGIIVPLPTIPLHRQSLALVQTIKAYERLTVDASLSGSREIAVRALTLHPLICSFDLAKSLVDSYLDVNSAYLPQFK